MKQRALLVREAFTTITPVVDLLAHVEHSICRRQLFSDRQTILVAVSGGLDSMVLLKVLHELSRKKGWKLVVAHLNHQLRGKASKADEEFVRKTAARLGLPLVISRAEVRKLSREQKISIEMAARKLRHDFLARVALRLAIPTVVLAHHEDDQIELFFLRMLRGSGGEGLAGMKWKSPSPANRDLELVRPLLDLPKDALRDFARQKKVRFREDATNLDRKFERNRIRHELLPLLKGNYQKSLGKTIHRLMEIVGAEADLVTQIAEKWLVDRNQPRRKRSELKRRGATPFDKLSVAVQRRVIQLQLTTHGIYGDFELIEKLRLSADSPVAASIPDLRLSAPNYLWRERSGRIVLQSRSVHSFKPGARRTDLRGSRGNIDFEGIAIAWTKSSRSGAKLPKRTERNQELFDAEKIGSSIVLRHWRPGDRFMPIGMNASVKLQDFFTNQKIPRNKRVNLVVGAASNGEIFWVEGLRISESFKIAKETKRRLQWRWKRLNLPG